MIDVMQKSAQHQEKAQLFARAVANGVLSERDRLLNYSIGEFYNEMSLFIRENEIKKKEFEALKKK